MIGRVNTGGGKGAALTVTAPAGATVTASKDGKTLTRVAGDDGVVVFRGLETGTWTLSITDGTQTASKTVEIVADYATEISYNVIPEFTYTGDFEIVNDSDEPITVSQDNWKIRLLTSGTLTFSQLNGAENGIDVFLVGGGAGGSRSAGSYSGGAGGGGGYTKTEIVYDLQVGTEYEIIIGAGGAAGTGSNLDPGGTSSAFGLSANGASGIDGGSGGGGPGWGSENGGNGGSDGSNGTSRNNNYGKGQGTTTREFGDVDATLYSGGGGGEHGVNGSVGDDGTGGAGGGGDCYCDGAANTGGGGGAKAAGGSGIVIIRNARRAV